MRTDLEVIPGVCGPLYNNFPTRVKNTLYVTPGYNALGLLLRQNNGQTFIRRTMEQKHSWGFSTIKQGALANNFTYLKMLDDMFIYLPSDLYATIMNDLYGRNGQYQEQLKLQSHAMYGSNRLGVQNSDKLLKRIVYNGVYSSTTGNVTASYTFTNTTTKLKKRKVKLFHGQKRYELTDHLGNVVTTISERRVCDSTGTFSAEVITQTGYEPFGAGQAGRQYQADKDSGYRFGFNGHEMDDEIKGRGNHINFGDYGLDPRTGRRWSIDKRAAKMPGVSPYSGFANNPILMFDADGLWPWAFWVRSFISTETTGGSFRGDGRGPSTNTDRVASSSRIWLNFLYNANLKTVHPIDLQSDYTALSYGPSLVHTEVGDPDIEWTGSMAPPTNFFGVFGFHYKGQDPITPEWVTPYADVHGNFAIGEDIDKGLLYIYASFTGDKFPSLEAFIEDQSCNKLFLGAKKEEGGIQDIYGEHWNSLFTIDMQIKFDEKGNFQGVYDAQNESYILPDAWNKQVQSEWDDHQEE